jgi:hypothetical protein
MRRIALACTLSLAFLAPGGPAHSDDGGEVPGSAREVEPIDVGATIPAITLNDPAGNAVPLRTAVAEQPTVLVFYRGGW